MRPGDEVITTPFTFVATAEVIEHAGARPVFVDIDAATFNLDPAQIEARLTERTRAIIPVHLYGLACDMAAIGKIAQRHKLKVIEDCAQATGSRWNGRLVGGIGDAGAFSFFPTKNLGAIGDGGMVLTDNDTLAEKVHMLRGHGAKVRDHYELLGYNSRLDSLQAAVLSVKLPLLEGWNAQRRANAARYRELLGDLAGDRAADRGGRDSAHVQPVQHPDATGATRCARTCSSAACRRWCITRRRCTSSRSSPASATRPAISR